MIHKTKNERLLPNRKWLMENGYRSLVTAMRKRPEFFAHIPQEQAESKRKKRQR